MAGEVHPVPFRTRKLSPPAPMVLRSKSVGEQDVADQRGAFSCAEGGRPHAGRPPSPCVGHGMRPCLAYAPSPPCDALPSCPAAARRLNSIEFGRPGPYFFILCRGAARSRPLRGAGPGGPSLRWAARGGPARIAPPPPPELCASRGGAPRPLRASGRERILTPRATARRQMPAARARDEP